MLVFRSSFVTIANPRALPLGRLTKRTPTHTPVPPQTRLSSPSRYRLSFLNSFFCYELDIFNIRIHVHSYACVCIHMHFIVFCMHSDALHSTIWLHSKHFATTLSCCILPMRDGCILMHFHTCCILDMLHSNAFSCIQKVRFMLMHSPRDAYVA